MTSTQQWFVQVAAAAVCGWALGKLAVELARGGAATLRGRYRMREVHKHTTGP
jgi:hypothetical protein